jgi:signal transduction histidine kinase
VRGSLKLHLLSSLVLPPVIVAAILTMVAIKLFRSDKELYVYDLSAQSVELVARNLTTTLESLAARAALHGDQPPAPPLLAVRRIGAAESGVEPGGYQLKNVSREGDERLEIRTRRGEAGLAIEIRPEALLDLRGFAGLTNLLVVNDRGAVLVHPDRAQIAARRDLHDLVLRLGVFSQSGLRVGTRALELDGVPTLVAHARAGSHVAVLQTIARKDVFAAADPLITTAALASAVVVLVAVLLALLLGRSVIRPLRAMAEQVAAIGRGEFGAASGSVAGSGEVARLQDSLNAMGASLKRREQELRQVQQQLLQAERLNTAGRMASSIVKEISAPLEACFALAGKTLSALPAGSELRALQEQILSEADRASNVLQNLSRASTRDEGGAREVELDMVVADVLISAGPLLDRRHLSVETDLSMPVGRVRVSQDQIRNALLDIFLFVAQEATEASAVLISVWRRAREAVVSIQHRVPDAAHAEGKGMLVLTVATSVIEDEGGRLVVERLDEGSRINVSFPLLDPEPGGGSQPV